MLNAEKALRFGAVRKLTSLCSASTDKQKSTPARQTAAANAGSRNHSATVMPSLLAWEAGVGRPARPPGARGPSGSLLGVGLHPGRDVFLLLVLAWSPLHSLGASGVGRVCLPCGSVCSRCHCGWFSARHGQPQAVPLCLRDPLTQPMSCVLSCV